VTTFAAVFRSVVSYKINYFRRVIFFDMGGVTGSKTCNLGPRLAGLFALSLRSLCSCRCIRPYWGGGSAAKNPVPGADVQPNSWSAGLLAISCRRRFECLWLSLLGRTCSLNRSLTRTASPASWRATAEWCCSLEINWVLDQAARTAATIPPARRARPRRRCLGAAVHSRRP
jgi:hypothetical protein